VKKRWVCMDCGYEFETPWIPFNMVKCPRCGSKNVHRIDEKRGFGYGPRHRRGICSRLSSR